MSCCRVQLNITIRLLDHNMCILYQYSEKMIMESSDVAYNDVTTTTGIKWKLFR